MIHSFSLGESFRRSFISVSDIGAGSVPDSTLPNTKHRRCHGTIGGSQHLFSIASRGMSVRLPISGPKAEL